MKRISQVSILSIALLVPVASKADVTGLGDLIAGAKTIVYLLIPLAAMLAIIYFFWGVTEYVRKASDGSVTEGRSKMIWGIIGLFVIFSISGILVFFQRGFGTGDGSAVTGGKVPIGRVGVGANPETSDLDTYGSKPTTGGGGLIGRIKDFFGR